MEEVNYRLTKFILEVMRGDDKPYPANSLYAISTGLLRHSRVDLNRYDLNILSKDDPHLQSFRKARGSFDCGRRGTVMLIWDCLNTPILWLSSTSLVPTKKAIGFIIFNGRISENVEGGLQQRKVDLKTVKQYARLFNRRCVVEVFREYMRCTQVVWKIFQKAPSKQRGRRCQVRGTGCWNKYFVKVFEIDVHGSED